jgi:hypothetical protein
MKLSNKPILVIATLLGMVLSGCGRSNNNNAAANPGFVGGLGTVPGVPGFPGATGGCYPIIQGVIPFVLQNAYIDSANIIANQSQMFIGGAGAATGGTMFISNQWRGVQGISLINMSVAPMGNNSYQGQGVVQLSQAVIQQIMLQLGAFGQAACVTAVSLNAGHSNERLYNGRLYLNLAVNGATVGTYTVNL